MNLSNISDLVYANISMNAGVKQIDTNKSAIIESPLARRMFIHTYII